MPRPKPLPVNSQEERLADAWLADAGKVADRIAAEEGGPPQASKTGEAEAVRAWGQRDAKVDRDALAHMLLNGGVPPEAAQHLLIAQTYPELLPAYLPRQDGQAPPITPEEADQLATLAEYPFRAPLVLGYSDDYEEQCRRAEALGSRWEQQQAAAQAQAEQQQPIAMQPMGGMDEAANG